MEHEHTIIAKYAVGLWNIVNNDYFGCRDSPVSSNKATEGEYEEGHPDVGQFSSWRPTFYIYRGAYGFDLTTVPSGKYITGATLTVRSFISQTEYASQIFELTAVAFDSIALTDREVKYTDWAKFGSTAFGSDEIILWSGIDWPYLGTPYDYVIEFNEAGLQYIRNSFQQEKTLWIALRSDDDINAAPPEYVDRSKELVGLAGWGYCTLVLETAEWPEYTYPAIPDFPDVGYMDIGTYAVIKSYIEDLTYFIGEVVYGTGIYFNTFSGSKIYWDGTDEQITRDQIAEVFEVTSLADGSSITTCGSATINALTNTTLTTTGNAEITVDLEIPSADYASIKEQIEHDLLWWEATDDTPSVSANSAKIYQELSSGDLKITINSGSTKTAILADFSGL